MNERYSLPTVPTAYTLVAVVGFVVFEAIYFAGYYGSQEKTVFSVALYSFNLAVIASSVVLLLWEYRRAGNMVVLLPCLAVLSWFLGILFYTSYVFMLGEILLYPSVAQFAFHGFHLVMVPLLFHLMRSHGVSFWRPSALPVAGAALLPVVTYFLRTPGITVVLYNVFYLSITVLAFVLAAHLVYHRELPLFGGALLLFLSADVIFITTTLVKRDPLIFFLHPFWFTASALIGFSVVRYSRLGELPTS
ncbi:MAG: hypothetical protein SV760_04895 [Halobacteria archaeon]|nr:hypothetical protein [Halobacteria archaeon]